VNALHIAALVVFIVVADAVALIFVARRIRGFAQRQRETWETLARQLSLPLRGGEPLLPGIAFLDFLRKPHHLEGAYRGQPVKIAAVSPVSRQDDHSEGRSSPHLRIEMPGPNPKGLGFSIFREFAFHRLGKALGLRDIETGDTDFDRAFIIQASDPEFMRLALVPSLRAQLRDVWQRWETRGFIELRGDMLAYDETLRSHQDVGQSVTQGRISAMMDALVALRGIAIYYNR
jgi:hypothetical protein